MKTEPQTQFRLIRTPGFRAGKPATQYTLFLDDSIIATKQRVRENPLRYIVVSLQDGMRTVKWKTRVTQLGNIYGTPLPRGLTEAELATWVLELHEGKHRMEFVYLKIQEDGSLARIIDFI